MGRSALVLVGALLISMAVPLRAADFEESDLSDEELAAVQPPIDDGKAYEVQPEDVEKAALEPEEIAPEPEREGAGEAVENGMARAGAATRDGLDRAGDRSGEGIDHAMDATGSGLDRALRATGRGIRGALEWTGNLFYRAGDAMTGGRP